MFKACCVFLLLITACFPAAVHAQDEGLALLKRPGHHAIIRHALAPGVGDPQNMRLGDCKTQRNLNEQGRIQAKKLGDLFRKASIKPTQVLASPWCRTLQSAELLNLGPVIKSEEISSVWTRSSAEVKSKTRKLKQMLAALPKDQTLVMVTHSVNISALTGRGAASAQGYVITLVDNEVKIVGRFEAPK